MRIEVRKARGGWTWAFIARNGKQTANNEVFASRGNAIRAAKAVVGGLLRWYIPGAKVSWSTEVVDGATVRLIPR